MRNNFLELPSLQVNKHISFQGDLYHGILHHIYPPAAAQRGKLRATLLVNYWEDKVGR